MFWIDPKGELVFSVVHTSNPLKRNTDTTVSVRCPTRTDGIQQTNHTCSAQQLHRVISPFSTQTLNINQLYRTTESRKSSHKYRASNLFSSESDTKALFAPLTNGTARRYKSCDWWPGRTSGTMLAYDRVLNAIDGTDHMSRSCSKVVIHCFGLELMLFTLSPALHHFYSKSIYIAPWRQRVYIWMCHEVLG